MLGLHNEALSYFGDSAKLDLCNRHENTKDGVHTANMGGCYMAIVNGFAGVRITEEGLGIDPFLPEGITRYSFPFTYRGSDLKLSVDRDNVELELISGDEEEFMFRNNKECVGKEKKWTHRL